MDQHLPMDGHRRSGAFPPEVIAQIQRTATEGHYEIRGWGAKRDLPTFDDLLFLTASLTRYPLEGYREKCDTSTVLGTRYASKPLELAIPVTIAGMSFGALSATAKMALGRVAGMRTLPPGVDQRSASRHPDWVGPDDLRIKIEELREATSWEKPVYVKFGATRVVNDVKLAVEAGADVVVVDGMQGGTAATQDFFIEHTGIPTLAAVRLAAEALRDIGM